MQAKNYALSGGMAVLMAFLPGVVNASTTLPFNVSGVPTGGYPNFEFSSVMINLKRTGPNYQLDATYSYNNAADKISLQFSPTQTYDVYNPSFTLKARLDSTGALVGGGNTVSIKGYVPDCGPGCDNSKVSAGGNHLLFSADLVGFGSDTVADSSPASIGFKTTNFSGWATQFATSADESVYLYNFPVTQFVNSFSSAGFFKNSWMGASVTTVPVPAAAWLFGSALAVLSAARRKKAS